ncbi:outer membrane protein [Brucellaceae bacterium C25G]
MKKIIFAAIPLYAISLTAHAADAIMHHDIMPVIYDTGHAWTGGYVGIQTGYQNAVFRDRFDGFNNLRSKSNGVLGGVYGGYNFEFWNRAILGIEADLTYNSARQDNDYVRALTNNQTIAFNHESKMEWSAALRARLGFAMDRWMPYIAGGVATAKLKSTISNASNYHRDSTNMTGWTIGAGLDYALATRTTLRLEYRHSDYGSKRFAFNNFDYKTKLKTDEFRIGMAYRF